MLFGGGDPLLLFGQALVLQRDNDLTGNPRGHLGISLVEPVGLALGEPEHSTNRVAEDEWRGNRRADTALEHRAIARKQRVELGPRVPEQHQLLRGNPRSKRVILESVLGDSVLCHVADQQCGSLQCSARPDRSHDHEIELEDASHDRAELLEDVADVEAGGHDTRHLGEHGHSPETIAFLLPQHQVLDDRAEHLGDPPSHGDVSLGVHIGRDRRYDEAADHPIDTFEWQREAGRQTIPLHVRDR